MTATCSAYQRIVVAAMGCAWVLALLHGSSRSLPRRQAPDKQEQLRAGSLLQSENPNYARLTFQTVNSGRCLSRVGQLVQWKAALHLRRETPTRLPLDGHCSWIVRDLETTDRSRSSMISGLRAIPAFHEDKFYMVGGYGFSDSIELVQMGPRWLRHRPARQRPTRPLGTVHPTSCMRFGGFDHAIVPGTWQRRNVGRTHLPHPTTWNHRKSLSRNSVNQNGDSQTQGEVNGQLLHFRDVDDRVFGESIPIGSVETQSWVIFILDDGRSTPALHKASMQWYGLDAERSLPFGPKQGLYGWMVNGDVLSVVNKGEVFKDIDLNAHMASFRDEPEVCGQANFLLAPYQ